jgi:hypothetical protein
MNSTLPSRSFCFTSSSSSFEPGSFRAAPHDREAGVRDLPHYLGKSPDGYMNAFPVEQATGVEKSRRS